MRLYISSAIFLYLLCGTAQAWQAEDMELFDLVEEVNLNFYEFVGVPQNASSQVIKRAYRALTIQLHPDKNPTKDTTLKFRHLIAIYEVLKDPLKREKYDKVIKEGLPNWKSTLYYYRRMRKLGLYECLGMVFLFISLGQYMFAWAAYLEKKNTAITLFGSKTKQTQKKHKAVDVDAIISELPKPSLLNTLPVQIPVFLYNLPWTLKNAYVAVYEWKREAHERHLEFLESIKEKERIEFELAEQARQRKEHKENVRKRKANSKAPEKSEEELRGYTQIHPTVTAGTNVLIPAAQKTETFNGGFWTDDDLAELIRLVKKFPSGTANRWGTISETMNRSVMEVTYMAAKLKEGGYRLPGQTESIAERIVAETQKKKQKKQGTVEPANVSNWTQEQQQALESAIAKYLKNTSGDRWQKIANCVPNKSMEECKRRFKYVHDLLKSQNSNGKKSEAVEAEIKVSPEDQRDAPQCVQKIEAKPVEVKLSKRELRRCRRQFSETDDSDASYE